MMETRVSQHFIQGTVTWIVSVDPQNTSWREAGKALMSSFNFLC